MNEEALFDVDRHIVVRPNDGALVHEVVHNDAELARYLKQHPAWNGARELRRANEGKAA